MADNRVSHVMLQNITLSPLQYHRLQYMTENTFVVPVVPVPTPQCIDVDEVHAGNRLSLMVTSGACCFEPRKSSMKRFRSSGDIRTKLIVCHREGFRDSKPIILPITGEEEEPMVKAYNPKKTKVTRIGSKTRIFFKFVIKEIDQVQVPLFVVDQFHVAHNHRLSPLKYREFQKKNVETLLFNINKPSLIIARSILAQPLLSGLKDAQMFVDQLDTLHETQEGFYYAYDIDRNKCLFRVFWADAAARRNYALYVPATFTTAAHRYCMWHIMKKLPEKLGTTVTKKTDFVTRLNSVVWDSDLEPSDIEERWCLLISEFQLEDNAWLQYLFSKRQHWIPAYYRDIPLGCLLKTTQRSESENSFFKRFENPHGTLVEFWMRFQSAMDQQRYTQKYLDRDSDNSLPQTKTLLSLEVHASTVYTHALFYEFQQQCVDSLNSCSAGDSSREGSTRFLDVEDSIFHKTYIVAFNPSMFDATCSCKMFERKGYICKHIIWILSGKEIKKIPDKYLLSRWTKNTKKMPLYDVHGQLLDDFNSSDVTKLQISTVWSEFYSTLTLLKSLPENHINELTSLLKSFRQNFKSGAEKLTKQQELEMLLGVKSSSEVCILPPVQSKNKGSGKRLMSKKGQSIAKAQKPKRFCNNYKQIAHHDKRNCPNPAVDTSQHSFDHESDISSLVDSD
ncbi:protein FAR1-RELATED SEQUENCE 2-like [Silene latifolia]|uniref:protein FAR1-RELATED SEQUENCE 2-like n=1 Tax=Silene latifolia TaxID=37657 RepID=UPI003D77AAAE